MKKKTTIIRTVIASIFLLMLIFGSLYYFSDFFHLAPARENGNTVVPENSPDELRVLSYNVFLRPGPISQTDYPIDRARLIGKWIKNANFDIVALQEAWQPAALPLLTGEISGKLTYFVLNQPPKGPNKLDSGGLAIFSRWPIVDTRTLVYDDCNLDDCLAAKGAVHAVVRISENASLNVVTTHLDAGGSTGDRDARASQVRQLSQFIAEIDQSSGPIVITGDFNIDSLSDNDEYEMLLDTLGVEDYIVSDISTKNCDGMEFIYCEEAADPARIDYVFTLSGKQRLVRKETLHLPLATGEIDQYVKYLSDHRAVLVTFEINFN
jgi:endonuclease/exonuclease/phosphatase family metal-dependent hydrolase